MLRRLVPSAYRPVLSNRVFRRLILGFAVSYLGDGMSFVAVAWLAIELAPQATAGLWVGGAVAAYTCRASSARWCSVADCAGCRPGGCCSSTTWRRVPRRRTARLARRAADPAAVRGLLAVSSLLHAWAARGTYTLLAELLSDEQRLAANILVSSLTFAATIAGPAIAGVMVTYVSAALVLGLDALTYVFLVVLVARTRLPETGTVSPVDQAAARGGFALLRTRPELLGLLTLTWFFNFLYGPVEVALPLHVTDDLHAPGSLLGLYWALFGVGAVLGGLAVGALRQLPLWPVTVAIVIGWGLTLLPFGFDVPTAVTIACFTLGGAIYGTIRRALGNAHAGAVASATPGADVRRPQRGSAHRIAARHGARRTAHHGAGPASDARQFRARHRGARGRRVRPAADPAQETSERVSLVRPLPRCLVAVWRTGDQTIGNREARTPEPLLA
jgi:hypothetical protein